MCGQDHLDLTRTDAERQRPEGAVRGGVGVAADDGHARLREPELRPDDVDDAAGRRALAVERDPELAAVRLDLGELLAGQLVHDRKGRVERGDRMVGRGYGLARLADLESALPQAGERLRAGDLVDEVEVDREDRRRAGLGRHDVVVPDLLQEGAGFLGHNSTRDSIALPHSGRGIIEVTRSSQAQAKADYGESARTTAEPLVR